MHILIIPSERYVPPNSPLEGIFQQHQAKALKKFGYRVGVLSPPELWSVRLIGRVRKGHPSGIKHEEIDGIPVYRYFGWIPPKVSQRKIWLWFWLRAGKALFADYVAKHGKPNVIHAHNARFAGVLAHSIKQEWRIPYVLTEHSTEYARNLIPANEKRYIDEAFQEASRRVVVSPALGQVLTGMLGSVVCPWQYVPNILDEKFENLDIEELAAKQPNDEIQFLNVGSLVEKKGQADLLTAFAASFRGDGQIRLKIGGDGPLRPDLEELSCQLGVNDQVSFLGELTHTQVLKEMLQCDAYIQSSHYETFGVVCIEALACGKPVVSTISGGPEYIIREHNGLLIPVKDIEALSKAMLTMRSTLGRYDAQLIRQDCIYRFGERSVIGHLSQVYDAVADEA